MNSIDASKNLATAGTGSAEAQDHLASVPDGATNAEALAILLSLVNQNGGESDDQQGQPFTGSQVKVAVTTNEQNSASGAGAQPHIAGPTDDLPTPTPVAVADTNEDEPPSNMGDDILKTLNAQSQSPVQPSQAPLTNETLAPAGQSQSMRIETIINQVVDRILVTDPLSGQNPQIHIKIADHVLPGTELQLWRGDGGQLNVQFVTQSSMASQALLDASQILSQRLTEKLNVPMPVIVTVQNQGEGGMPQDGRSRQYQSLYDLNEETA